jgi:adenylate cyclase
MLSVHLKNRDENRRFEHAAGPLEFGRGQAREAPRCVVTDPFVSRDHVRIERLENGRLRVDNLSAHSPVTIDDGFVLEAGASCERDLPIRLQLGKTDVSVEAVPWPAPPPVPPNLSATVLHARLPFAAVPRPLHGLGETPDPETLAHWFETVITVQQAAATSEEFLRETARAVVDLVGLDRGLVLLKRGDDWQVVAMHGDEHYPGRSYSRGVLDEVLRDRRTLYRNLSADALRESLVNIDAVVAAPVFDREQNVIGVVYGSRTTGQGGRNPEIRPLEAQIVQVLAAAVGAGLARQQQQAEALRAQVQFEQFFSPQLARELARDQGLLEGRDREVTILFSDLRGFTRLSEQLGPKRAFRLMQELMEMQSAHILESDGVVVDYYGDGLLAMWNAPTDQPDHAERGCRAALHIVADVPRINGRWSAAFAESNMPVSAPLRLGIGLNTGGALVGNTGSRSKFKYGPMGPTVNLASRVEGATKALGVPILITRSTRQLLGPQFAARRLCSARLAGVAEPVDLFELSSEPPSAEWIARRDAFESALQHYEARRFAEACQALYPLLAQRSGQYDVPTLNLLSRAVECLKSQPDPFSPVMDFPHK